MSTHPTLQKAIEKGLLIQWDPITSSAPSHRCLFITSEILDELDGDTWEDQAVGVRYGQLEADFDRFAEGQNIPVALDPYDKSKTAFLARIDPVNYGIWTLRSVDPRPAIRVFGAFFAQDHFVCLCTAFRKDLDGPGGPKWAAARENAITRWNTITHNAERKVCENVEDYISQKTTAA